MFTGSELPLNQLASFPGFFSAFACRYFSPVSVCSNSAAASGETGSGEIDRSLASFRKGRNVDDLEGELDRLEGGIEAKSLVVSDRRCASQGRVAVRGRSLVCESFPEMPSVTEGELG